MYRAPEIYDEIKKTIIDIYLDYGIKGFPIDEKCVCKKMGIALIPYSNYQSEERKLLLKKSKHGFFVPGTTINAPTILNILVTIRMTLEFPLLQQKQR